MSDAPGEPRVRRRLQTYEGDGITVTFDPVRCIHARECVRGLPAVFDPRERRWIRPERAAAPDIAAVIERCPTGALQYRRADGRAEAAPTGVSIRSVQNGPLYIRGPVEIVLADGRVVTREHRVALCRCGASRNQPFCDGSHVGAGFVTSGSPD